MLVALLSLALSRATSSLSSRSGTLLFSILSARFVLTLTNLLSLSPAVSDATLSVVFRLTTFSLSYKCIANTDSMV